jgi:hypothetical protein
MSLKKRKSKLDELFPEREALRVQKVKNNIKINTIQKNENITNRNSERF